jgi:hypothetical protein
MHRRSFVSRRVMFSPRHRNVKDMLREHAQDWCTRTDLYH